MCIDFPTQYPENLKSILCYKLMEKYEYGYRPVFGHPRDKDSRIFEKDIEYHCIGRLPNDKLAPFHGCVDLQDILNIKRNIYNYWNLRGKEENYKILIVELSGNIQFGSNTPVIAYSSEPMQVSGKKMKIVTELEL